MGRVFVIGSVNRGANGQHRDQCGLTCEQLGQARVDDVFRGDLQCEPEEQPLMTVFAGGELRVEALERRVGEPFREQGQPLRAARFDDARDQETIELALLHSVAHQLLQALRVGIAPVAPQQQAPVFHDLQHLRQVG